MTTTNTKPGAKLLAAMESESDFASHAYIFPRHDGEAYLADLRALIAERDREAEQRKLSEERGDAHLKAFHEARARCERLERALRAVKSARDAWRSQDEETTIDSIEYMDRLDEIDVDAALAGEGTK